MVQKNDGKKSSEFWLVILTGILVTLNSAFGMGISEDSIKEIATVVLTYVGGRSVYKAAHDYSANRDAPK